MNHPSPTPMFRSFRARMALSHGAVLALIVLVLGGTSYLLLSRTLDRTATGAVTVAAQEEVERVAATGVDSAEATNPPDNDIPSAAAIRLAVFLPNGRALGEKAEVPSWLKPHTAGPVTIHVLGERVRLVTLPVRGSSGVIATVVAGKSLATEEHLLGRFRLLLGLGGLAAVAISMLAGWILAGRAAMPIKRSYEAQASFAADASHELRTPLAFLQSGVEVLAEHDPELGEEMLHEVGYLANLADRLLTLARADSRALHLDSRPVEVVALCRRAAERSERVLGVRTDLTARGELYASADPVALEAALDAVLENVARHGGGRASIACRTQEGRVRIVVADRGPGMVPEQRTQAFDRFYRVDTARSREHGGAGLGLPLSKALTEAQGGQVWLEETPGGGLTAVFAFPPAARPAPSPALSADTARH